MVCVSVTHGYTWIHTRMGHDHDDGMALLLQEMAEMATFDLKVAFSVVHVPFQNTCAAVR